MPPSSVSSEGAKGDTTIVLVLDGPIARPDIPGLCERVRILLEGGKPGLVVCDVSALATPDAVTVDALARLQLTASRLGRRIVLLHACGKLQELLALTGLRAVVPLYVELPLETRGEPEQREELRGIEEESDPGDLPA
ncbi:MAG: STAS domain-containing protein [Actinomycetota bacterium]